MELIFATANKGKFREACEILGEGFTLHMPSEYGILDDVEETGTTLKENSIIKARYIYGKTGLDCFADDTGLEVDCLGGAPGVYTARYAGEGRDFDDNMDKLLYEMASCADPSERTARFRTVTTLILGGREYFFDGTMEGRIATGKAGCGGFGYDPVFVSDDYPDRTVAELSEEVKNSISHRGRCLRAMAAFLSEKIK